MRETYVEARKVHNVTVRDQRNVNHARRCARHARQRRGGRVFHYVQTHQGGMRAGGTQVCPVHELRVFRDRVTGRLGKSRVRWAMPCSNRLRVRSVPRKFSARRNARLGVADPRRAREGGTARDGHREKEEGAGREPGREDVAFAAGGPAVDAGSPCSRRRRIEIGYKMARQTRIRTPGRNKRVRIFCFAL